MFPCVIHVSPDFWVNFWNCQVLQVPGSGYFFSFSESLLLGNFSDQGLFASLASISNTSLPVRSSAFRSLAILSIKSSFVS